MPRLWRWLPTLDKAPRAQASCLSLLAAAHMEDIVAFVSDDENLTTVVAGVAVVGATIVGGLYASTRETAAQEADSGEKLEQAPRIGGRQKKKAKGSKPVLPKKTSKQKEEKKARWDVSSDEEEGATRRRE